MSDSFSTWPRAPRHEGDDQRRDALADQIVEAVVQRAVGQRLVTVVDDQQRITLLAVSVAGRQVDLDLALVAQELALPLQLLDPAALALGLGEVRGLLPTGGGEH